jgi:hypothetical protein
MGRSAWVSNWLLLTWTRELSDLMSSALCGCERRAQTRTSLAPLWMKMDGGAESYVYWRTRSEGTALTGSYFMDHSGHHMYRDSLLHWLPYTARTRTARALKCPFMRFVGCILCREAISQSPPMIKRRSNCLRGPPSFIKQGVAVEAAIVTRPRLSRLR